MIKVTVVTYPFYHSITEGIALGLKMASHGYKYAVESDTTRSILTDSEQLKLADQDMINAIEIVAGHTLLEDHELAGHLRIDWHANTIRDLMEGIVVQYISYDDI